MDKLVYIFFGSDYRKLYYNLYFLYRFCKKNNLELLCITKKENKENVIKIKNKINIKFYLVENIKDIRKIKIEGKFVAIYEKININLRDLKYIYNNIEKGKMILVKKNFFGSFLYNPFIVGGYNINLYENIIKMIIKNERKSINLDYKLGKDFLYIFYVNLKIYKIFFWKIMDVLLKKKYIRDYINEKIGLILYKIFTFILTVILVRILTQDFYGAYIAIYNFILILSGFMGITNTLLMKKMSENIKNEEEIEKYIKVDIYSKAIFFVLALIIISLFSYYILENIFVYYSIYYLYLSYAIAILIVLDGAFFSILYSYLDIKKVRNFLILESLFKLIFISLFAYILKKSGFLIGMFIAYLVFDSILFYYVMKKYGKIILNSLNKKTYLRDIKEYLKLSIYLNIIPFIVSAYSSFEIQIIKIFTSFKELGLFYNANLIVSTISSIFSVGGISLPRILRWDDRKLKENINKIVLFQLFINIVLFFMLVLLGPYIIILFFGESYLLSADLLKYLSLIIIIQSFNIYSLLLYRKGMEKYYSIYFVLSVIFSFIFDIFLIYYYGVWGAVYSIILANLTNALISYGIYKIKYDNISTRSVH
ncbi:MAG: lipopolysaccharide biosynthesis protein [Nanopusillaceae archaeon]